MPELPEAETIARGLRGAIAGRTVRGVEVLRPDLLVTTEDTFTRGVAGKSIGSVGRRGKNLVLAFGGDHVLVVNLGMSGRLLHRVRGDPSPAPSHPGVRFHLDDGATLVYHDVRRFGRLALHDRQGYHRWSRSLGPEPLGRAFTAERMRSALHRSSSPVRSWLLDQSKVAGVGNIYANEAIFLARVDPRTPANRLPDGTAVLLHQSLRSVLREAIRARGTTLRDYRTADGWEGSYAGSLRVYGRDGAPCSRCRTPIERLVFGGRSAFRCPRCQPDPGLQAGS